MSPEAPSDPPIPDLDPRDRIRRAMALVLTPAERLAAMQRQIDESWAMLVRHPEGMARFRRRNFRARSLDARSESPADGA